MVQGNSFYDILKLQNVILKNASETESPCLHIFES